MAKNAIKNDTAGFSAGASALAYLTLLVITKAAPGLLDGSEIALATAALTTLLAIAGRWIKWYFIDRHQEGS